MHTFVYILLAVVIYGVFADRMDRADERELRKRASEARSVGLVEDFEVRPDLGPRYGRRLRRFGRRVREPRRPDADQRLDHTTEPGASVD